MNSSILFNWIYEGKAWLVLMSQQKNLIGHFRWCTRTQWRFFNLNGKTFWPYKINIENKTSSLNTLIKRIQRKSVQLNTESYFQRKDDLWDSVKQSRLIESILIRFPLPAFFFDAKDDSKSLVVDAIWAMIYEESLKSHKSLFTKLCQAHLRM